MTLQESLTAYFSIVRYETIRMFRVWQQTLVPPAVTTALYFIIFGHVIGSRVGPVHGMPYATFIAPGLVMMQMILGAYTAAVFTFFFAKFSKSIEEILVSPMSSVLVLVSYMSVGMVRGITSGLIVMTIAAIFAHLTFHSVVVIFIDTLFATAIFALLGVINGVYAKKFDDVAIIPNFVLTPLTYFGGVFYSIAMLPPAWRYLSHLNPIYYIVSVFRFGFLGLDESLIAAAFVVLFLMFAIVFFAALFIFKRGAGLRP